VVVLEDNCPGRSVDIGLVGEGVGGSCLEDILPVDSSSESEDS
jgi:hypothetical protein